MLMLNKTIAAARAIKGDLIPTEASIDMALGHLGQLISTACKARLDAGLPAHVGQEAMDHLTAATAMMGKLRSRVIQAHVCLAQDGRTMMPTGLGDLGDCPAQASIVPASPRESLRAVA
jgi:hypothetical protein